MKKTSLFFLCVCILPIAVSLAAVPPVSNRMSVVTSMSLTYDLVKHSVHVQATHPSDNWAIDYVRMLTVSLNGQEVSTLNYDHQTSVEFSEDVPVTAQVGDVIKVELFCTGGSSTSRELTVTDSGGSSQPDQGADASAVKEE
jgi:hypothetical protein